MKVIFLDFDGVLNSYFYQRDMIPGTLADELDPAAIEVLNEVLTEVPDVKIVISSSWRKIFGFKELVTILSARGFQFPQSVIGVTPDGWDSWDSLSGLGEKPSRIPRGVEIRAWLDINPEVEHFVIIDDEGDMDGVADHLLKVNGQFGLRQGHIRRILSLLRDV